MARKKKSVKYFSKSYYFDKDELKKEYRALSKKYHPDLGGSNEIMALINSEYELLKNEPLNHQSSSSKPRRKRTKTEPTHEPVWDIQEIITILEGLDIDYWIDGDMVVADKGPNVYANKEKLKNVGFWWDAVNRYWYWVQSHSKRKSC